MCERIAPLDQVVDPDARDLGYIQDRETGAVVLESKPFARAPHRDQIVEILDVRSARNGQPQKADITPLACSREHEDRRDRPPVNRRAVCPPIGVEG
jgi:hypothetical protein